MVDIDFSMVINQFDESAWWPIHCACGWIDPGYDAATAAQSMALRHELQQHPEDIATPSSP